MIRIIRLVLLLVAVIAIAATFAIRDPGTETAVQLVALAALILALVLRFVRA